MNSYESKTLEGMFGLTLEQTKIMFSIERELANHDKEMTKSDAKKLEKEKWIARWTQLTEDGLRKMAVPKITDGESVDVPEENVGDCRLYTSDELADAVKREAAKSSDITWYYMVILESTCFSAYFPLNEKESKKLLPAMKYKNQDDYLKMLVFRHGLINDSCVERFTRAYKRALLRLKGGNNILVGALVILAVTALAAALCGAFAGPIAIALFGSQFAGLSGAALTSACLALAGGGAIATEAGMGMAGGVIAIVCGGAFLGLTAGTAGATAKAICEIPSFAMLQVAKFEVAVKEIILNEYKNVELAKKIIENYVEMATQIKKDALLTFDKKEMKNKKKSAEYAEKSCEELSKFVSAFENGKGKL